MQTLSDTDEAAGYLVSVLRGSGVVGVEIGRLDGLAARFDLGLRGIVYPIAILSPRPKNSMKFRVVLLARSSNETS